MEQVLVAAQDLPMGSVITETGATWQGWPKADVSELMITKRTHPIPAKEIFGSMLHSAFIRGEPIRTDKLVRAGSGGFMSAILPTGMRAVAIKIDNGRRLLGRRLYPAQRSRRRGARSSATTKRRRRAASR